MAGDPGRAGRRLGGHCRIAGWGTAAAMILLPLAAMQVTDEVNWGVEDFGVAIALVGGVGLVFELAVTRTANAAYRAAAGVALATAFVLVWSNLAVGIVGSEDNPANLMFFGVLAVGIVGTLVARFRPYGMGRAMVATAFAQVLAGVIAMVVGWGLAGLVIASFAALWLASAWLFRKAAQEEGPGEPAR